MAQKVQCQTVDGTKSISLLAPPYSLTWAGIDRGEATFTDAGKMKNMNDGRTTDADRNLRTMGWTQQIDETTIDLLNTAYAALKAIICQPQWVLVLNDGGASSTDRYYDCYAVTSVPQFTSRMLLTTYHKYDVRFEAKPFSRGPAVDLPRNWVKDPTMQEDYSADGIPNSFTLMISGTPTYTISVTSDGWTKIAVTAGVAGEYVGIQQTAIPIVAGNVISSRLEFKCDAATGGCSYNADVYEVAGAGGVPFAALNARTTVATAQEAKAENRTVSAATTSVSLRAFIQLSATGTGTLYVRNAMIVKAAALPMGADGGTLFYSSQVAQSPATMAIHNVPGDVAATVIAAVMDDTAIESATVYETLALIGSAHNETVPSLTGFSDGPGSRSVYPYILNFAGKADTNALGGVCSIDLADTASFERLRPLGVAPAGSYQVIIRLKTSSTTPTTDQIRIGTHATSSATVGTVSWNDYVKPFTAAAKYCTAFLGTIEVPTRSILDPGNRSNWLYLNYPDTGTYVYNIDYIVLFPTSGSFVRAEIENPFDGIVAMGIELDTTSENTEVYVVIVAPPGYPLDSSVNWVRSFGGLGTAIDSGFTVPPNRDNYYLVLTTRKTTNAAYVHEINGSYLSIQYTPRFLE